jgi:hypothetical protein
VSEQAMTAAPASPATAIEIERERSMWGLR